MLRLFTPWLLHFKCTITTNTGVMRKLWTNICLCFIFRTSRITVNRIIITMLLIIYIMPITRWSLQEKCMIVYISTFITVRTIKIIILFCNITCMMQTPWSCTHDIWSNASLGATSWTVHLPTPSTRYAGYRGRKTRLTGNLCTTKTKTWWS